VLIAHEDSATMSRYRITTRDRQEDHKSSGLWVATAAGSSSAILAAGGRRLAWTAKRFQYRPRELYQGRLTRYRLTGGVLSMGERVEVTWLMREGFAFVDGPHVRHALRFGDRLVIELSASHPLRVLGIRGPRVVSS
jgi:NAD+ kinase